MTPKVLDKIDKLIEEDKELLKQFNSLSKEEQNEILSPDYADKEGNAGLLGSLGHGALVGGVVGGGSLLANELVGTNIDPMTSGLLSAGATGLINAPGSYQERKQDATDLQSAIRYAQQNK